VLLCTLKPTCIKKLIPAAGQSSLFSPVLDCVFGLEGHLVNLIHHQISGDLIMNYKNDWTAVCIFFKDASKDRKRYLFHIILGSPEHLYDRNHKYVLSTFDLQEVILLYDQWYLCVIYLDIIRILVPTLRYIVFRCDT